MKKVLGIFLFVLLIACGKEQQEIKKINDGYSFKTEFVEKTKMGENILRILVFDKDNKANQDLTIIGNFDMPSMKGHHGSAPMPIRVNKGGDYLMPLQFVMPGEWEIVLDFYKDSKKIHQEIINVNI